MQKSLKQEAEEYVPPTTKNITELEKVSVDTDVVEKEYSKDDGSTFTVKVITVDGEDYRVPITVIKSLKVILKEKPGLKYFKVARSGEGFKTVYTVITLE